MKCVKATHYGFRTVIVVCHNPAAPEYLHDDGTAHPSENVNGCGGDEFNLVVCHTNHQLQEFIWDGDEQYEDGVLRTDESFWAEVCDRCVTLADPERIDGLIGLAT